MCRDFTIICITKKLEVKMPAYTSFIFDVRKSNRVEKIVLHCLIFLLSRLVFNKDFIGSKYNFITAATECGIKLCPVNQLALTNQ